MLRKGLLFIMSLLLLVATLPALAQESPQIVNRSTTIQKVDGKEYFFHAVLQGQTLFSIAKAYGVSKEDILRENPELEDEDDLQYNQMIRIPVKKSSSSEEPKSETIRELTFVEHRVKRRETVYGISRMYNITQEELLEHNPDARTGLRPNMIVKIPQYRQKVVHFIEYTVPPRQTLFSISREFGVTIAELEKINPELRDGLKAGQTLRIPAEPEEEHQPPYVYEPQQEEKPQPATPKVADPYCADPSLKETYHVALLIPLYLENMKEDEEVSQKEMQKSYTFIEYYQGILLALDSLRASGADIRLTVMDVDDSDMKARQATWKTNLGEMDLIIGPFYPSVFPIIADFARERDIPVVAPLYSANDRDVWNDLLKKYPNMFQAIPGIQTQVNDMADYIVDNYSQDNIILVHNNQPAITGLITGYKNSLNEGLNRLAHFQDSINMAKLDGYFFNGVYVGERITNVYVLNDSLLKAQRRGNDITEPKMTRYKDKNNIKEIIFSRGGIDELKEAMDTNRRNVIVSLMGGEAVIADYARQLNQQRDTFDMVVFGVPQWNEYRSVDYNYLRNLNVHIFTSDFVDYENPDNLHFIRRYRSLNHVEPGPMGFWAVETGMYFFTALMQYGSEFYRCMDVMNQSKPYDTPFWFERANNKEGWENKFVYIYTYKDYQLIDVRNPRNKTMTERK